MSTALLLAVGALVTGTGSSLAVPDWPLAYGQLFPPMVGGILYEHGHRLAASTVGLLTVVMLLALLWLEPRRWVKFLGGAALAVVIFQGLLGGLTVIYLLPKPISIGHAVLAQLFFLMTVALVQATSPRWEDIQGRGGRPGGRLPLWSGLTAAVLLVELVLGAIVRHNNAGLAIPDFPLAYGGLIPPLESFPVMIHFAHRMGALAAAILIAWTVWVVLRDYRIEGALIWPAAGMGALLLLQILLGGAIIWSERSVPLTTLHLVNGALLLALSALLFWRALLMVPYQPLIFSRHAGERRSA